MVTGVRAASASRLALLATLLSGCILPSPARTFPASGATSGPRASLTAPRTPGQSIFKDAYWAVRPDTTPARLAERVRRSHPQEAAWLDKIAGQPTAAWMGNWNPRIEDAVGGYVRLHERAGGLPILVLYNLPFRDCGQHSAGGSRTPARYRAWIDGVVRGIGDRRAVLILEPDGLPMLTKCLDAAGQAQRLELVKYAVDKLTSLPGTAVYIDAGHSAWATVDDMAPRLLAAGIARADGFSLNVSNYQATRDLLAYGHALSARAGGKHFVIDTGRNGNGPPPGVTGDDERAWCNPDGRALGVPPTTSTGDPLCDAFLWIKPPGESDGTCNHGPAAGGFYLAKALELARNAHW